MKDRRVVVRVDQIDRSGQALAKGQRVECLAVFCGVHGTGIAEYWSVVTPLDQAKPDSVLEHGFDDVKKMKFIKIYFNEDLAD